jgi:type II secretory pathway pseudopilin PulG
MCFWGGISMKRTCGRGFSLLELLMALFFLILIIAMIIPSYNNFRRNQACATAARDFETVVKKLRQCAITQELVLSCTINAASGTITYRENPNSGNRILSMRSYLSTVLSVPGGAGIPVLNPNPDGTITATGIAPFASADPDETNQYYIVRFTARTAQYDVQVYSNGKTKMVKII